MNVGHCAFNFRCVPFRAGWGPHVKHDIPGWTHTSCFGSIDVTSWKQTSSMSAVWSKCFHGHVQFYSCLTFSTQYIGKEPAFLFIVGILFTFLSIILFGPSFPLYFTFLPYFLPHIHDLYLLYHHLLPLFFLSFSFILLFLLFLFFPRSSFFLHNLLFLLSFSLFLFIRSPRSFFCIFVIPCLQLFPLPQQCSDLHVCSFKIRSL